MSRQRAILSTLLIALLLVAGLASEGPSILAFGLAVLLMMSWGVCALWDQIRKTRREE